MILRNWLAYLLTLILLSSCKDNQKNITSKVLSISSNDFNIAFENIDYEKKYGSCANDTDCADVKILYPKLLNGSSGIGMINSNIISQLLSTNDEEMNYKSFDEIADSLFADYQSVQKDFSDYRTAWFIHKSIELISIVHNYISLKNEVIIYTGGANNYYNVELSIFDLNSGKKQSLTQFVKKDRMAEFLKISENQFRKIKNIKENQTIEETGFWFENDKFYLPENFSISDSGFVFFYNLYEIAPRSEGFTELFIPKEELKDIIITNKIFE